MWDAPIAPDGQQVGFIQGYGTISQNIDFAEAGTYTLSFQAAYRDYYTGNNPSNPILIQVDGIDVGTITPQSTQFQGYRVTFSRSAGTHTVPSSAWIPEEETAPSFIDRVAINKTDSLVQMTSA